MSLVHKVRRIWLSGSAESIPNLEMIFEFPSTADPAELIQAIRLDQQHRWKTAQPLRAEEYIAKFSCFSAGSDLVAELIDGEIEARLSTQQPLSADEISSRFPELSVALREKLTCKIAAASSLDSSPVKSRNLTSTYITPSGFSVGTNGRYRLDRILGEGAFGAVYLGYDCELKRQVAVKVPNARRFGHTDDAEAYLVEAQTVAKFDHPHIVPVYDVGRTDEGTFFIISRYLDGGTLKDRITGVPWDSRKAVQLLIPIAKALHYAHEKRFIHRDVKPANILLEDLTGAPFITDFGLAVREEDYLNEVSVAGTPAYMSPEQARGEGHRLDGRSDIFSLGIILYELLTGRRPFQGISVAETLHKIVTEDPPNPRELQGSLSPELERICLKALSKRASDRYISAAAMSEDLDDWSKAKDQNLQRAVDVTFVSHGLRSFGPDDAGFFLDLLPGSRNREQLPESISFWKQRIEECDPDKTFTVGLLCGPSGCGKSSLVKAGLLPRLSNDVVVVYLEATPDATEHRIVSGLQKQMPDLDEKLNVADALASLRRGGSKGPGNWPSVAGPDGKRKSAQKVIIILDQFEQWLHSHGNESDAVLIRAFRQCDGSHLQAILMIRDDFAMAAARFMRAIETRIVEGQNFATVDLFEETHARKVLMRYGQAFGKLPQKEADLNDDHHAFINSAVASLAQDGRVVSVRLALFSEMVKGKAWVPATLVAVGGAEGLGVNFLEGTFHGRDANPDHRFHAKAAREVLKALLPDVCSDIKGHMRSESALLAASGYQNQPSDFRSLLSILDRELRLITPTQVEEVSPDPSKGDSRFFQLTHDYLVPSLREWLSRKQKETRKGRAEIKLAERAAVWNSMPETRHLPSLSEFLNIRLLTKSRFWTDAERAMMTKATRLYGIRSAQFAIGVVTLLFAGFVVRTNILNEQQTLRFRGLVGELINAEPAQVPDISKKLAEDTELAERILTPVLNAEGPEALRGKLHAQMATVSRNPALVDPLLEELLSGKETYIIPIRDQLKQYSSTVAEKLRHELNSQKTATQRRFRAAIALAEFVAVQDQSVWTEDVLKFVATELVSANPEYQPTLRAALHPIHTNLLPYLFQLFGDSSATEDQRLGAANAVVDWAPKDIERLVDLISIATPRQFPLIYPLVQAQRSPEVIRRLHQMASQLPSENTGSVARLSVGQKRANSAITLLQLGEPEKALSAFDMTDDPEAVTQFVFGCRPRKVAVTRLNEALQIAHANRERYPRYSLYGLLLALGEFSFEEIPIELQEPLLTDLRNMYAQEDSSSVHSASGWLLTKWGQEEFVRKVDRTPIPYTLGREWFTLGIKVTPTASETGQSKTLQETEFFFTFIVFPAGNYTIGAPDDEPGLFIRDNRELRHSVTLTQPFAILNREITFDELIAFYPDDFKVSMAQFGSKETDAGTGLNWYNSVMFCRWLGRERRLPESDQAYPDPESLDETEYPREQLPTGLGAPMDWPILLDRPGFRLPLDNEWEVAARGGARTAFCFGGDQSLLPKFGWYEDNSELHVHAPTELRPNLRGLFDVHGNLSEWTHDWYGNFGLDRLYRGGNWDNPAKNLRVADRATLPPSASTVVHGLRLALSLTGSTAPGKE